MALLGCLVKPSALLALAVSFAGVAVSNAQIYRQTDLGSVASSDFVDIKLTPDGSLYAIPQLSPSDPPTWIYSWSSGVGWTAFPDYGIPIWGLANSSHINGIANGSWVIGSYENTDYGWSHPMVWIPSPDRSTHYLLDILEISTTSNPSVQSVNSSGLVVGSDDSGACYWEMAAGTGAYQQHRLPMVVPPIGWTTFVNSSGQIMGGEYNLAIGKPLVTVWTKDGDNYERHTLEQPDGTEFIAAVGFNSSGTALALYRNPSNSHIGPIVWEQTGSDEWTAELLPMPGSLANQAYINDAGVVAGNDNSGMYSVPLVWTKQAGSNYQYAGLPVPTPMLGGYVEGINANGWIAGVVYDSTSSVPVVWKPTSSGYECISAGPITTDVINAIAIDDSGRVVYTIVPSAGGPVHVYASVPGDVGTAVSRLKVMPLKSMNGDNVDLTAILLDRASGARLANRNLTFRVDGVVAGYGTTSTTGTATCPFTVPEGAGPFIVTASYTGDETYAATTGASTLTVAKCDVRLGLAITPTTFNWRQSGTVKCSLKRADNGKPIADRFVSLQLNGYDYGVYRTDSNGAFQFKEDAYPWHQGDFSLTAVFDGSSDPSYNSGSATVAYTIKSGDYTKLKVQETYTGVGTRVKLLAFLSVPTTTAGSGWRLSGETVTYKINGNVVGTAVTGTTGWSTFVWNAVDPGEYTVEVVYNGKTDVYAPCTATGKLYVSY